MKIFTILFAVYFSLLGFQPAKLEPVSSGKQQLSTCEKTCCLMQLKDHFTNAPLQKHGKCCSNGACNPFNCCSCSIVFLKTQSHLQFVSTSVSENFYNNYNNHFLSPYLFECFHPPEIV